MITGDFKIIKLGGKRMMSRNMPMEKLIFFGLWYGMMNL